MISAARAETMTVNGADSVGAAIKAAWTYTGTGRFDLALASAAKIEADPGLVAPALQKLGELYTICSRHDDAHRCFLRALALAPNDAACQFNVATSLIAQGKFTEAEALLDDLIARHPRDYAAYYTRAGLRRQTPQSNHVDAMLALLHAGVPDPVGEGYVCYALAKELEDLREYDQSFAYLKRGADNRRRRLSYRIDEDERAIADIISTFSSDAMARASTGHRSDLPIFVLGLPRSGTTLVDRILDAHGDVDSLGEVADFGATLTRLGRGARDKFELIRRSINLDMAALGQSYCDSLRSRGVPATRLIDKTPLNYLYIGLIARALPDASIVHVRRKPMEGCFAMYKTLFRMGYPFSYDLDDLARYYIAFDRLMKHWRALAPANLIEVSYETLVADQEGETRRLLAGCGLNWDERSLAFHESDRPVATASAAQVRQPIYKTSVGQWRRYEKQLAPLADALRRAGIDVEGA
jgi:tetratricopeptide (TPR) repeat protein